MAEHTRTPWEAQPFDAEEEDGVGIIGLRTDSNGVPYSNPTNGLVAWATLHPTELDAKDGTRAVANAAFIVKAVNSHDALVKALKQIAGLGEDDDDPEYEIARRALALVGGSRE